MQLGSIQDLARSRSSPSITKRVQFKVLCRGAAGEYRSEDAEAVLCFVDEEERREIIRDAYKAIREFYGDAPPPPSVISTEFSYYLLAKALHDTDDARKYFCASPASLRKALHERTASELTDAYEAFVDEEFPKRIDQETFDKLVADAENFTLAALLRSSQWSTKRGDLIQALPSLVARLS